MLFEPWGIALGISLTSVVAHAEEPTAVAGAPTTMTATVAGESHVTAAPERDQPAAPPHIYRWYGAPTLGVDLASLGLAALSNKQDSKVLAYTSIAGFALGGPINHAAHGNWGRAAGSLALRVSLPVLAGVGGALVPGACDDRSCVGLGVGIVVGILAASAVDAAALSWEKVPQKPAAITPLVAVGKDMAYVGASGTF
jgi:hypothetical protein